MNSKTWGPFTGSQLTIIIVAVALCFAIPGGLWAAGIQFSLVSLYDAKSKQVAKLGPGGALKVGDGVGPLTVDGSVSEAPPADLVRFYWQVVPSLGCMKLATAPATKGLVIKQVIMNTDVNSSPGDQVAFYIAPAGCTNNPVALVAPPAMGVLSLDLGPGFAVPAGSSLWVWSARNVELHAYGTGYFVPAAAIPAATTVTVQSRES